MMNLHLVVGVADCLHFPVETVVYEAIKGGVTHVQLREKTLSTREFISVGLRLKKILKAKNIPLIINDRVDIALAIDAEGVHLGQSDMPYFLARHLLGNHKIIGVTIENLAQLHETKDAHVQYLGVGPIFPTKSKQDAPEPLTITSLQKICQAAHHPVIAIGGINVSNVDAVIAAGAQGVAVVSAITQAKEPEKITRLLKKMIQEKK
jgi:thiamine-phosphate pyrophosphorylase